MYKTAIAAAALLLSQAAGAAAVIGSTTGLAAPATTITFDEQALAVNSAVTNQFAPQGITFSPYLSVSYTHLDVYKRQSQGCSCQCMAPRGKRTVDHLYT